MARAYNIFVVEQQHKSGWRVFKAFTVKHELISFLNGHTEPETDNFRVTRVGDGRGSSAPKYFTIEELLEG